MSSESDEVQSSYNRFLEQLSKTDCLYLGEDESTRHTHLKDMIDGDKMINSETCSQYVDTMNYFIKNVKSKKKHRIGSTDFIKAFAERVVKKENKAAYLFCFNKDKTTEINLGQILLKQLQDNKKNVKQIQSYLFILYIQSCNFIYREIPAIIDDEDSEINAPFSVKKNYIEIMDFFQQQVDSDSDAETEAPVESKVNGELNNKIKGICSEVMDQIMPGSDMKNMFGNMMGNPQMSAMMDTMINSMYSDDDKQRLNDELNEENMKKTLEQAKQEFGKFNLGQMMQNMGGGNTEEGQPSMDQMKEQFRQQLGDQFDDKEFDQIMNMDNDLLKMMKKN
uniref:Uncharacterized protein n=1 Tax=Megaviridae environmental sample TaxID=1737588 RepID=A0A5J6VIW4_9VIRU|nr:MAG: hypothetical protein [Megaviridae environmental sample]